MNIKNGIALAVWLVMVAGLVNAKEIKYKVADIPKDLKENARSVVRNEEIVLNVKSVSNATRGRGCDEDMESAPVHPVRL